MRRAAVRARVRPPSSAITIMSRTTASDPAPIGRAVAVGPVDRRSRHVGGRYQVGGAARSPVARVRHREPDALRKGRCAPSCWRSSWAGAPARPTTSFTTRSGLRCSAARSIGWCTGRTTLPTTAMLEGDTAVKLAQIVGAGPRLLSRSLTSRPADEQRPPGRLRSCTRIGSCRGDGAPAARA